MKAPDGHTKLTVVIGDPVDHTASPLMLNAAFEASGVNAVCVALRVEPANLAAAIAGFRATGVLGVSVTIPHKQAVIDLCDRVEEPARSIGAVNCLSFASDGAVVGHNTDAGGFVDGLAEELGLEAAGKRVAILGGGGAARAVHAGLVAGGASEVAVVVRNPERVSWIEPKEWSAEVLAKLAGSTDILVDCTSAALSAETEASVPAPFPVAALHDGAAVVSLVYHRRPELLDRAEARGLMVSDGLSMLVHQGARAYQLWTGQNAPVEAMSEALRGND